PAPAALLGRRLRLLFSLGGRGLDSGLGDRRRLTFDRSLLLAPPPLPSAGGAGLRLRQVLGDPACDLLDLAQPLARRVEELRRTGRVALGGGEQRGTDLLRHLERGVDELRGVLLVPVAA